LCNRKSLARTSSTPGKTQCVNHFLIDGKWYIVDLPGYGFAKLPKKMRENIDSMIKDYTLNSQELALLFVLLDSRHKLLKNDLEFLTMLGEEGVPFSIIFTKSDKMGKNALTSQVEANKAELLNYWEELPPVFVTSSHTGKGREELLDYIGKTLTTINNHS
ncbi:MAG: ribosome biogenesis GTP-binding protein YsxC, partial [Bacteroidales bacterium]|nr:ribosome biogenesis GTP-binding protein YsxC [Bacteroidales bacterium]